MTAQENRLARADVAFAEDKSAGATWVRAASVAPGQSRGAQSASTPGASRWSSGFGKKSDRPLLGLGLTADDPGAAPVLPVVDFQQGSGNGGGVGSGAGMGWGNLGLMSGG